MRKLGLFVSLLAMLIFVNSCSTEVETQTDATNMSTDGRVVGFINGVVKDAYNNKAMDSIIVTWQVRGEKREMMTDSLGYYRITDLPSGNYVITYYNAKKNAKYAVSRGLAYIKTLEEMTEDDLYHTVNFDYEVNVDMKLYALNAGLSGRVYAQKENNEVVIAANATVIADFSASDIVNDKITTTTDADGKYSFTNLPATANVSITTLPITIGGILFGAYPAIDEALHFNENSTANDIKLTIAGNEPIIVLDNFSVGKFNPTSDLSINFSKKMNPTNMVLELKRGTENVLCTTSWNSDNTTLTINPYLNLRTESTYSLTLKIKAEDNTEFDNSDNPLPFTTFDNIKLLKSNIEIIEGIPVVDFSINSNIVLTFDKEVNISSTTDRYILTQSVGGTDYAVACNISLDATKKEVIIDPIDDLDPQTTHKLDFKACAKDDIYGNVDNCSKIISFTTKDNIQSVPARVTNFMCPDENDYNSSTIHFTWTKVSNAKKYQIAVRTPDSKGTWLVIHEVAQPATEAYVPVPNSFYSSYMLADSKTLDFAITAVNEIGSSPISSSITIKDNKKPSVYSTNQNISAYNMGNSSSKNITISIITSEPMNQDVLPSIEFAYPTNPSSDFAVPSGYSARTFQSNNTLTFEITIPPFKTSVDTKVKIKYMKDTTGNIMEEKTFDLF